jgi:hypothetical protein
MKDRAGFRAGLGLACDHLISQNDVLLGAHHSFKESLSLIGVEMSKTSR